MCVICVKGKGIAYPEEKYLRNCFDNNSHGAGFMVPYKDKVRIRKGFKTYEEFKSALDRMREKVGDDAPCVMHFRIATQGYERGMTHPFPLSSKMDGMTALKSSCNIGVAHNGILDLTSDGAKDYSDTMKFISDYLSLIIRNFNWFKDKRTVTLIERLIDGSRLAIMDKNGNVTCLGEGWIHDKKTDCWFSNNSYEREKPKYTYYNTWYDWEDDGYDFAPRSYGSYDSYGASQNGWKRQNWNAWRWGDEYNFSPTYCPFSENDDDSYCLKCKNKENCHYYRAAMDFDDAEPKNGNLVAAQTIGKKAACL